jgi:hypothetical protein
VKAPCKGFGKRLSLICRVHLYGSQGVGFWWERSGSSPDSFTCLDCVRPKGGSGTPIFKGRRCVGAGTNLAEMFDQYKHLDRRRPDGIAPLHQDIERFIIEDVHTLGLTSPIPNAGPTPGSRLARLSHAAAWNDGRSKGPL